MRNISKRTKRISFYKSASPEHGVAISKLPYSISYVHAFQTDNLELMLYFRF